MDQHAKKTLSRRLRRYFLYLVLFLTLFLMLLFPKTAALGALEGLLLWSKTLLPILLPFLILSGLLITLHMTKPFELLLGPIFTRIFPVRESACYPLFVGLLCGMPLGAKTTASLYESGRLSEREAMFLLGFSNQASMMFLISYVATQEQNTPPCFPRQYSSCQKNIGDRRKKTYPQIPALTGQEKLHREVSPHFSLH